MTRLIYMTCAILAIGKGLCVEGKVQGGHLSRRNKNYDGISNRVSHRRHPLRRVNGRAVDFANFGLDNGLGKLVPQKFQPSKQRKNSESSGHNRFVQQSSTRLPRLFHLSSIDHSTNKISRKWKRQKIFVHWDRLPELQDISTSVRRLLPKTSPLRKTSVRDISRKHRKQLFSNIMKGDLTSLTLPHYQHAKKSFGMNKHRRQPPTVTPGHPVTPPINRRHHIHRGMSSIVRRVREESYTRGHTTESELSVQPNSTCDCENGASCIMRVICVCPSNFYGMRCEHSRRHYSCDDVRHGTWIRRGCTLCRCQDGKMFCVAKDINDCEDVNGTEETLQTAVDTTRDLEAWYHKTKGAKQFPSNADILTVDIYRIPLPSCAWTFSGSYFLVSMLLSTNLWRIH